MTDQINTIAMESEVIASIAAVLDSQSNEPKKHEEVLVAEIFDQHDGPIVLANEPNISFPYLCQICRRLFDDITELVRHVENHNRRRFKCELCGVYLKSRASHKEHLQRHKNTKNFQCDECQKYFVNGRDLKNHRRIHLKERFTCKECGKNFSRIYTLIDHRKQHMLEMSVQCVRCEKVFTSRRKMLLHMRTHYAEDMEADFLQTA